MSATAAPPQDNQFTGAIPSSSDWRSLHILRVNNNNFTYEISEELLQAPLLMMLDISDNRINVRLPAGRLPMMT